MSAKEVARLEREITQIKDTQVLIEEHNRMCIQRSVVEAAQAEDLEEIYALEEELAHELSVQRELEMQLQSLISTKKQVGSLLSQAQRVIQS